MNVRELLHWLRESSGVAHARRVAAGRRDPWQRIDVEPPLHAFGPGASEFREYLARECRVPADNPREIARWLLSCRYAEDAQLLDEPDLWLHPATFELVRSGDCEDFALWTWRRLVEAGYDTDFVVGVRAIPGTPRGRHAWVTYRETGVEFLFDGVERSIERMIRPVADVRAQYEPQVGVDATGERFAFAGMYREVWGRSLRLRARGPRREGWR